jgi:ABC-type antimicrobial peptide transport system permease subunit
MGAGVGFRPIESAVVGKVSPSAELRVISADYFRTLRVPLLSGRLFDARDADTAPNVVIVNQSLVRRYFGKRVPLGQRLVIESREPVTCTIVGVVGNMHQYNLREAPSPEIFAPFTQQPWILHDTRDFVIRSALDPPAVTALLRQLIRQMEPEIPFKAALPMDEVIGETLVRPRFYSAAFGIFAGAALLLAAFGIYGAVAGAVAERTREIGIRTALGAGTGNVVRFVASQGALPAFVGLAAGLPLALVSGRVVAGYFEGVGAPDWTGIVVVAALQLGVALLAAALPARRAARLDPAVALRQD